jgi:hypothetical protein
MKYYNISPYTNSVMPDLIRHPEFKEWFDITTKIKKFVIAMSP